MKKCAAYTWTFTVTFKVGLTMQLICHSDDDDDDDDDDSILLEELRVKYTTIGTCFQTMLNKMFTTVCGWCIISVSCLIIVLGAVQVPNLIT